MTPEEFFKSKGLIMHGLIYVHTDTKVDVSDLMKEYADQIAQERAEGFAEWIKERKMTITALTNLCSRNGEPCTTSELYLEYLKQQL